MERKQTFRVYHQSPSSPLTVGSRGLLHFMQFYCQEENQPSQSSSFHHEKTSSDTWNRFLSESPLWYPGDTCSNLLHILFLALSWIQLSDVNFCLTCSHACQQHQCLDCPSYLPCRYCTWSSCSLRTHHETIDKGNTEKCTYVEHNFDVRGEYMTLVHQILTRPLLRPW